MIVRYYKDGVSFRDLTSETIGFMHTLYYLAVTESKAAVHTSGPKTSAQLKVAQQNRAMDELSERL